MYIEFQPGQKFAGTIADKSPMHEAFKDAGWCLTENDLVVDIDGLPKATIEKMIETFGIKTQTVWTDRGAHLYFNKPKGFKGATAICPLGFPVEYKHFQNTKAITIKRGGVLRKIDNLGARDELPDFLYIRTKLDDLNGLGEGDGRNQKLYAHKFKIMSVSNYKKVLTFINQFIFSEPMDAEELATVIREEQIKAEKNAEYEVAMTLKNKLKIVKYAGLMYLYDGEKYVTAEDDDFVTLVSDYLKGQKTAYIDEVIKQMKYRTMNVKEPANGFDIKFKNGILRNGQFIDIDSTEFTPYYIDLEYKEDAEPMPIIDDLLKHLSRGHDGEEEEKAYVDFLLEVVAHSLITDIDLKRNRNFQRVFFFAGKG